MGLQGHRPPINTDESCVGLPDSSPLVRGVLLVLRLAYVVQYPKPNEAGYNVSFAYQPAIREHHRTLDASGEQLLRAVVDLAFYRDFQAELEAMEVIAQTI